MNKISENIKNIIRSELEQKQDDSDLTGVLSEIDAKLVEPFLQTCLDVSTKKEIELYVVFKEQEELDSEDRFWIVYSPERKMFGLTLCSKLDKVPEFIGFDGSFLDSFFGR